MPITMSRRRNGVFSRRKNQVNRKDGRMNTMKRPERVHSAHTPCTTPKSPKAQIPVNENNYLGWYELKLDQQIRHMCSRQSAIWDPKQFAVLNDFSFSSGAEADSSEQEDVTSVTSPRFNDADDLVEDASQAFRDSGIDLLENVESPESKPVLPRTNSLGKRNSFQMGSLERQESAHKRRKSGHIQSEAKALVVDLPSNFRPNDRVRIIKGAKKQFLGKVAKIEKYLISKDKWGLVLGKKRIALGTECLRKVEPKHVKFAVQKGTELIHKTRIARKESVAVYGNMCQTGLTERVHKFDPKKLQAPMVYAIREARVDVIKALIMKHKCDINALNGLGQNALHIACQYAEQACAQLLIEMGIDLNALDNTEHSALMIAAKNGMTDIVADLLAARANMNFQDEDGMSALMFACKNGHSDIVELFLKNGAYIDIENGEQQNALMVALAANEHDIAERLMEAGLALEEKEQLSDVDAIHKITEGVEEIVKTNGTDDVQLLLHL